MISVFSAAMGGVSRTSDNINGKMNCDPDSSVYERGKQIMTVCTFVQEINDLRIAYSSSNTKKCFGHMLPIVRVSRDTPAEIKKKIRELKRKSGNRANRIVDSSTDDEEENVETCEDVFEPLQADGNSSTVSTKSESHTPSGTSSESEYMGHTSDSESLDLPDLTEEADPSYNGRPERMGKEKSRQSPGKAKEKKKKKIHKSPLRGCSSGELMKAARKNCIQKTKMFVRNKQEKRTSEEGNGSSTGSLPPLEPMSELNVAAPSCRMTGFVQLKHNAKSPKDVERESEKLHSVIKKYTDPKDHEVPNFANINEEQERLRQILKNRVAQMRGESKKTDNSRSGSNKSDLKSNHPGGSHETFDIEDLTGNDSDDTITYDADNKEQNAEILHEPSSPAKRKAVYSTEKNKKLRTEPDGLLVADSSFQLPVVPSPMPFGESLIENDGAEAMIVIQNVTGGVHDAFRSPEREVRGTVACVTFNDANLKKLKLDLKMKEEKRGVILGHINLIKGEIADWTEKLKNEEAEKKSVDKSIEDLKNQINNIEKSIQSPSDNSFDVGSPSLVPPSSKAPNPPEKQDSPLQTYGQGAAKGINIISDASISNFGMTDQADGRNPKTTSQKSVLAAPKNVARPSSKNQGIRRGHKTPNVTLADTNVLIPVQNSPGGIGPDVIIGANSQSHHSLPVTSTPQLQVSQQQPLANLQKPPPSYAEAVIGKVPVFQQTKFQVQSRLPGQPQTAFAQVGAHCPQQTVRPSHPQFQQLQPQSQPHLQPNSQPASFNQALQAQTPLPQMQKSHVQIPSQVQQMQLSHLFVQPQLQPQILPQLNTPGMLGPPLNPSSLPSEPQYVILPPSTKPQQGLLLLPTSGGPASRIIISSSPAAPTVVSSAAQSGRTVNSIAGVISSTAESIVSLANVPKGGNTPTASNTSKTPVLAKFLEHDKTYRPGPKSKSRPNILKATNTAAKQNPQTSNVPRPYASLPVSSNRGITALLPENSTGGAQPTEPSQVNKQTAKSHLMVAAQPTIKSGAAAQAKPQISVPVVAPYSVLTDPEGLKFGQQVSQQNSSNATTKKQDELGSSATSHGGTDECLSSPETENSCFLCGSPDTFVCCNNIVYCSTECKEKDWSRHRSECTNASNGQMCRI